MDNKPQRVQKDYWCYDVFDTFIFFEHNIYQVINKNWNNSASNLKVSMGRFIYFLNFFGHNMGLLEVLNTSETWCNLGV